MKSILLLGSLLACSSAWQNVWNVSIDSIASVTVVNGVMFGTSFGPLKDGKVWRITGYDTPNAQVSLLADGFKWPNMVADIGNGQIAVADGFLLPTSNPGAVYTVDTTTGAKTNVDQASGTLLGSFYPVVGLDPTSGVILAGKAYDSYFTHQSSLVAIVNNGGTYQEVVLADNTDFTFATYADSATNTTIVFGGSYLFESVSVYRLRGGRVLQSAVISKSLGAVFQVSITDFFNSGRKADLFVSTSVGGSGGAVFHFTVPADPFDVASYTREVVASGFPAPSGMGKAAPGGFVVVPGENNANQILLGGDDNGIYYWISKASGSWQTTQAAGPFGGTVGSPYFHGKYVYLPDFEGSQLCVYQL